MKRLFTFLGILLLALILIPALGFADLISYTVANRPSPLLPSQQYIIVVDCESSTACSVGGGSYNLLMKTNGTSWIIVGGGSVANLNTGTLTNGYLCTYTSSGTLISCNTNPASFQPALGLLPGTLTNGDLCTYTAAGTLISCTTAPATFVPAAGPAVIGTGGSAGVGACWKADGKTLGYCSGSAGACTTCN
ncbi:MAG: hypothetical protein ABSH41_32030 [Syntrophobacteraceae bacterium]